MRRSGVSHGRGKFVWADGMVYVGDWEGDQINGEGRMRMPDGSELEGKWKNGVR